MEFNLDNYKLIRVQDDYNDYTVHFEFYNTKDNKTVFFVIEYDMLKPENNKTNLVLVENSTYQLVLKESHLFEVIGNTKLTKNIPKEPHVEQIFCKYIDCYYNFYFVLRNILFIKNKDR